MKRSFAVLALFALLGCGGHDAAPSAPARVPTIDARHLDAQLTPYADGKLSGYVLVAQYDQPVYGRAFGFADRGRRVAANADTSFRIGSVTKQFTAAAILLLEQEGKLSVADPVRKHLPDYPAAGADVTIHQLLTHTSGIPSYTGLDELMATRARARTVAELMASFASLPLEFAPGERFAYSNSGYVVLGAIVEKVSGMRYGEFVERRLFTPAGMTRTRYGDAENLSDRALGYQPMGDTLGPAPKIDLSVAYAAGGVRSTANDLVRWHRALDGDAILGAAAKKKLYQPDQNGYAYGWFVDEASGHRVIAHGGGIDGFTTDYRRVPDLDLVVVVWSNNGAVDAGAIGRAALTAALGGSLEPVAVDAAIGERIAGTYALTEASREAAAKAGVPAEVIETIATMQLRVDGGTLRVKPVGQSEFAVQGTTPTTFAAPDSGVTIDVALPATGPASGIRVTQRGLVLEYARAR